MRGSRLNALSHGLLSAEPVVVGPESSARYKAFRRQLLQDLDPVGALELALSEQVAVSFWRLRRVALYETAILSQVMRRGEDEVSAEIARDAAKHKDSIVNPWHPGVKLTRHCLRRSGDLLKRLPTSPPEAPVKPQRAAEELLVVVAQVANITLEEVVLPGIPDDPVARCTHRWCVGNLKDAMAAIALKAQCDPERLEMIAQVKVRRLLMMLDLEAKPLGAKRQDRQRLCLVPEGLALDRILRYEAHLIRLLTKNLNQLEVAQARRRGEPTPLARLDIQGLPDP